MPIRTLLGLAVALAIPAHAAAQHKGGAAAIPFQKYTLANGLEVILHQDHRLPLVAVNVWYHVAAGNEQKGRSGFAHLFEHMMFQGSGHVGDDKHFQILESIGARGVNGSTSFDRTNYFEGAPSNQLETLLWLESDRMGFLPDTLTRKKLDNQKDVVRNERRQTTENTPYGFADEAVYKLLFPAPHPYHGVVIGSHEDLQAATLDDVKGFFTTYYAPGNATLVVAGDFDEQAARALIAKYFGSLPAQPDPPPVAAPVQAPPEKEIRKEMTDDVQLARITFAWVTVPAYAPGAADLQLAAEVLAGGKASVLYKKLVYDRKIAQRVSCAVEPTALGTVVQCDLMAKPGAQLAELEKELDAALDKLRKKGPAKADLDRVKTQRRSQFLHGLERILSRADRLNEYNHFTGDPGYLAKDLARFAAVTPASMQKVAARWLDPAHRVVVTVLPEEKK